MNCPQCKHPNPDLSLFCGHCGFPLGQKPPPLPSELDEVRMDLKLLVGHTLKPRYADVQELGRGGMAVVFKAEEPDLGRLVALKVLPLELAHLAEVVDSFQNEAKTAAGLRHPHIVPIFAVGSSGLIHFFSMPFLAGGSLEDRLNTPLPIEESLRIVNQVARALAFAHQKGVIHRDIKPDNILFDEHGAAIVTDFGIAKALAGNQKQATRSFTGTPPLYESRTGGW